ncbi:hypothetical protein ACN47E_004884 [Coniothyrium glycines]
MAYVSRLHLPRSRRATEPSARGVTSFLTITDQAFAETLYKTSSLKMTTFPRHLYHDSSSSNDFSVLSRSSQGQNIHEHIFRNTRAMITSMFCVGRIIIRYHSTLTLLKNNPDPASQPTRPTSTSTEFFGGAPK